jgi:hypothetical protein
LGRAGTSERRQGAVAGRQGRRGIGAAPGRRPDRGPGCRSADLLLRELLVLGQKARPLELLGAEVVLVALALGVEEALGDLGLLGAQTQVLLDEHVSQLGGDLLRLDGRVALVRKDVGVALVHAKGDGGAQLLDGVAELVVPDHVRKETEVLDDLLQALAGQEHLLQARAHLAAAGRLAVHVPLQALLVIEDRLRLELRVADLEEGDGDDGADDGDDAHDPQIASAAQEQLDHGIQVVVCDGGPFIHDCAEV